MKKQTTIYIFVALILGLLGGYLITNRGNVSRLSDQAMNNRQSSSQPSRNNCLADDCLAINDLEYPVGDLTNAAKEALEKAIADEYKALSVYQSVIAKHGTVRPFAMIIGAEEQHIASLKAIYHKYDLPLPVSAATSPFTSPLTLQQSCQIGVDAEIANAALYAEELLPAVSQYET